MVRFGKITGIVLSGGKSSRMGTEKGLVKYNGKALIEYSIDALKEHCDELVISSGNEAYKYLNLPIVKDEVLNCGPVGGIYSCMKAFPSDFYFVISCDVPQMASRLFTDLLQNIEDNDAVVPIDLQGKKQPLVACYRSNCFPVFETEMKSNRLKMMELLSKLKVAYYVVKETGDNYHSDIFLNANSPEDLTSL